MEKDLLRPTARRSVGALIHKGDFHCYGGFGHLGSVEKDEISDSFWLFKDGKFQYLGEGPYKARYPTLCSDKQDSIYMYGGCSYRDNELYFEDRLFVYKESTWHEIKGVNENSPIGRYTNSLCFFNNKLYLFGGYTRDNTQKSIFLDDFWVFDLSNNHWSQIEMGKVSPCKRYGFAWTHLEDKVYIFGGYDGSKDLNDFWVLDLNTLTWECISNGDTSPTARYCASLGVIDNKIVLFGGRSKVNSKMNFNDTWIFEKKWNKVETDIPYYHAKSGYASDNVKMFIFAGEGPIGHVSDVWNINHDLKWNCLIENRSDDPILW